MASVAEGPGFSRDWTAEHWPALRSIWEGLAPGHDEDPRFRGKTPTAQQAGWVFERMIIEAFRLGGAAVHYPYKVPSATGQFTREENDGIVVFDWQGFLVESKFTADPIDIDPIFRLHVLVEQRPAGTLGLFFSFSGYTGPAKESSEFLNPIRVLLFERVDLEWALTSPDPRRMRAMVWRKWAQSLTMGKPYLPIAKYDDNDRPVHLPIDFHGEPIDDSVQEASVALGEPT